MKKLLLAFGLILTSSTFAEEIPDFTRFEDKTNITITDIKTPKVVRLKTNDYYGNNTVLIDENGTITKHRWIRKSEKIKSQNITVKSVSSTFEGNKNNLVDNNTKTTFTFHPEEDRRKSITLGFGELTDVSGIYINLDQGIINPQAVSVSGVFENGESVIIVNRKKFSHRIPFPKVAVTELKISFQTPHFLRISEIEIQGQEETEKTDELVFFATEGGKYTLYSNAHFGQKHYPSTQQQPLGTDSKTPLFSLPNRTKNKAFNNDYDQDGLSDRIDLCPKIKDPKNTDFDGNGRGDACEDPDQDGKMSVQDNCPFKYNPQQTDSDADTKGDACDDVEDRVSENSDYLLYVIFGFAALFLGFLVWRSMKKH